MKPSSRSLALLDDSGRPIAPFNQRWLHAGLTRAASRTGWHGAWLLDDVVKAVSAYVAHDNSHASMRMCDFEEKIKETLCKIGYGELAKHFLAVSPCQTVSLLKYTDLDGPCSEGRFYIQLKASIQEFNAQGVQQLHLRDLAASGAELCRMNGWFIWDRCARTRYQIVRFVRRQLRLLTWSAPFRCSIS